jgi:predicted membrane protein
MTRREHSPVTPRVVVGLIVIALGVIFTLDNLGVVRADDVLYYWPVALVLVGLAKVISRCGTGFGAVLMAVGGWLLLERLDVIPWDLWDLWPVLLILLGVSMVLHTVRPRARVDRSGESGSHLNASAILGSAEPRVTSADFRGGDVTAVMGGCKVDLRAAKIPSGQAVIDVFAFWGGIDLLLPDDWNVEVRGLPLLGGFGDKTRGGAGPAAPVLVVKGLVIMGGVEIKN